MKNPAVIDKLQKYSDEEDMRRIVGDRIEADSWVVDGNYRSLVQDLVLARAAVVEHRGRRVEHASDAVPGELAHH